MKRARRRDLFRILGWSLATACAAARGVRAQPQAAPVPVGGPPAMDLFKLTNWSAYTELDYLRNDDSHSSGPGHSESFTENRFEPKLTLDTWANILHPNFAELHALGTIGLIENWLTVNGQSDTQQGMLYEWDVDALFLKKEQFPLTLYTRRIHSVVEREFGPSLDSTLTTSGGSLEWKSPTMPTRVEAYHTDQRLTAPDHSEDSKLAQDGISVQSEFKPANDQRLTWSYQFNSISESNNGGNGFGVGPRVLFQNSFDTHDATVTHIWDFGSSRQHNLLSSLNYFNQTGDFAMERFRLAETLRLRHTEDFETRLRYSLDRQSVNQTLPGVIAAGQNDQTQHRLELGFTHRLWGSLTTDLLLGGQQVSRSDGGQTLEGFANLNFDYHKEVPFGQFLGSISLGIDQQRNDAISTITRVINTNQTFNTNGMPIIIAAPGIIGSSVLVTDSTGRVIYVPVRDYSVATARDHIEIRRALAGAIPDGSQVLVSYDLAPEPGNTVTTNQFAAYGRYEIAEGWLKGLSVYARFSLQDQSIRSDNPLFFTPNSYRDLTFGAEYRFRDLLLTAEQQYHDSTIAPYNSTRFAARLEVPFSLQTSLGFDSSYTIVDYTDVHDHTELLMVAAHVQHRFGQQLSATASLLYRNERDQDLGTTNGWEQHFDIRWDHLQTHVMLRFRNASLDSNLEKIRSQTLELLFRRDF